jgi:PAS domain S-box-containing protein
MTRKLLRWLPALAIILVGTGLSLFASDLARRADAARVRSLVQTNGDWQARSIERHFERAIDSLHAVASYLAVNDRVTAAEFHQFATLARNGSGPASAIDWLPWIPGDQRDVFVAAASGLRVENFHILARDAENRLVDEPARDAYAPVFFQEAFEPDAQGPLGFDVLSLPHRREWITQARDSGWPYISAPLVLPMGKEQPLGFVALWPVYAAGAPLTNSAERRSAFRGVVLERFRFDRALPASLADTPEPEASIDFSVAGANAADAPIHVASYDRTSGKLVIEPQPLPVQAGEISTTQKIDLNGRQWTLVMHFGPRIVASLSTYTHWTWLGFGLALTALLVFYVEAERARRFATQRIVEARTAELASANRELARELEERRHAEEALRRTDEMLAATLAAAPFAMVSVAPDGTTMLWNRAAERIFGYSATEAIGRIPPIVPKEEMAAFREILARMRSEGLVTDVPTRRQRKDGSIAEIRFSGAPIYEGDTLRAFVGMLEDRTQANAIERQLVQAQKMEAIGSLTGGLAHDFNNLLAIIIGNLDLARASGHLIADDAELVADALAAALRGAELTGRLLAFARRQPLKPERIDPNRLIGEIVKLFRRTLGEMIQITLHLADDAWPIVVDPVQLEASLANLATNARDAMPSGGELIISTMNRRLDTDYAAQFPEVTPGEYVLIEVSDTGEGIPADYLGRIFEPFFTTKGPGKGTGLGLSMVFGFIKQSGGHINVYSEPGVGSTFRLYLPRAALQGELADPAERGLLTRGRGETVLVVEDNASLRRVVLRQLQELGYHPLEAENAAAAITILEGTNVDLVFSDVIMAGEFDGYALARRVRERWPKVKILLTSGFPQTKLGNGHGWSDDFTLLSKPYRRRDLAEALRKALD